MSAKTKTAKTTKSKAKKGAAAVNTSENAFTDAASALGDGIDALFGNDPSVNGFEALVDLDDIEIVAQVREEFESEDETLADLGRSLRKGQVQALLVRPNPAGSAVPYRLVAGERRVRAARLEGLTELRAFIREMSEEEAEDAQFAENIHRKNLTQIEEAKKIQRDLDQLGSVDAVLEKHQKSRAWLSKILALLNLPDQAKRLVSENVSADLEVINTVKTVEKADPVKAKALVDELKQTRGKANAREKATAVKDEVKPRKKPKASKGGAVARPKDTTQKAPGPASVFASAKTASVIQALNDAYVAISHGSEPAITLDAVTTKTKRVAVKAWLRAFYDAGLTTDDAGHAVIQGLRTGEFSSDGAGAFALVAFLQGVDHEAKFDLLSVFQSVRE